MLKATYDVNNNGIVDNAEKVNNHTVEKDVPANAVFTDTTYSEATTSQAGLMSSTDKSNLDSNTSARHTHSNKSTLDGISSSDISNWNGKQDATDNSLTTTNKTITPAINEVNSIAKGANQALSYANYQAMITAFNSLDDDEYNVGQNIYIVTTEVPDLWISSVESTSSTYTYVDDATFVNSLATNGYVQVGYYKLSMLETQKVDLTNYVKNTDYATSATAGVIKTGSSYGTSMTSSGNLRAVVKTYQEYSSAGDYMFVGKRTLENVINGKSLETADNKVTSISSTSTNTQYPGAKAVYDFAQSIASIEGDTLPIGAIIPFSSDTIPENWLLCDGQAVSRTTYQELFSAIGTTYGNGDGSTTFNLPDLQGKIPVGKDENDTDFNALGSTGGEKEHTLTTNEMPSHNHQSSNYYEGSGGTPGIWAVRSYADLTGYKDSSSQTGGNQAHNNVQPYIVQNYIMKAKQSAGVVATVVDGLSSTSATDALSAKQGKILNEKFSKSTLWENSSPTSAFTAQTITLSSSDYDYIMLYYARTPASRNEAFCIVLEKNKDTELLYSDFFNSEVRAWSRSAIIRNGTSVTFGECLINGSANNSGLVPQKIIGCKY